MDNTQTNIESDSKLEQLKAILSFMQEGVEDLKNEVDGGLTLINLGEKTEFVKGIEKALAAPIDALFNTHHVISTEVINVVSGITQLFFKKNNSLIYSVYKSTMPSKNLYYSIVLKDDTMENRNKIFEFIDMYDQVPISSSYPVVFQFVPIELIDKINYKSPLKID